MNKPSITLHMATTIDGFIAKPDGNSDWVSKIDCDLFEKRCKDAGCVIVGRKTFEQFQTNLYPMPGITNIVLTKDIGKHSDVENVFFVNSAQQGVELAQEKGHDNILIAGGGHTNAAFLEAGLIDEMYLSVHPLVLGKGIKLFEGSRVGHDFKLAGTREMGEGLVELRYII